MIFVYFFKIKPIPDRYASNNFFFADQNLYLAIENIHFEQLNDEFHGESFGFEVWETSTIDKAWIPKAYICPFEDYISAVYTWLKSSNYNYHLCLKTQNF